MSATVRIELSRADAERLWRIVMFDYDYDPATVAAFKAALAAAPDAPGEGVECRNCGAAFCPHPEPTRFDHHYCEACVPTMMERWPLFAPLHRKSAGK